MDTFKRLGLKIKVDDKRVEIRYGMFPYVRKTIIPMRSIASVEVSRFTKHLVIRTNDGKEHKYAIGGFGKAQRCRDAIAARL